MSEVCVRVAARVRPLLRREVLHSHQVCVRVLPGSSNVLVGSDRLFSFDYAFGPTTTLEEVHESCVHPLVHSLVKGYNATVFCYGQTGSGKTYTLGGRQSELLQDEEEGIIDHVAQDLFLLLEEKRKSGDCEEVTVRASYLELYKEELRDLLELNTLHKDLHIREDEKGNTVVAGAKEVLISSPEELLSVLEMGNAVRHTAATGMNEHSSRSHTILTLQVSLSHFDSKSSLMTVRTSKLCLVDLAGSERAGKTGNSGTQLKEAAHINTGLLALGNVIRALSEQRGNGCGVPHIPYRDAKITRLLRDSLGGTAHTLMIACVSPSNHFVTETLNVLHFASKARHIRNLPGAAPVQTEVRTRPINWHLDEVRIRELEYELQTMRELLREKEREIDLQKEKNKEKDEDEVKVKPSASEPDKTVKQEEPSQIHRLTGDAAGLSGEITHSSQSISFRQRQQDCQKRVAAVTHSNETDNGRHSEKDGDTENHPTMFTLKQELYTCQDNLQRMEQQLEQKEIEMKQLQNNIEALLEERTTLLETLEENKKIHSSTTAFSLKRAMTAFKMRGHPLLVEMEERDEVYCPFIKQQAKIKDKDQHKEQDEGEIVSSKAGFRPQMRCPLNRTWTGQQMKESLHVKNTGQDETCDREQVMPQPQQGSEEKQLLQKRKRKTSIRARLIERQIQELSVNMRMKEELIKELDKTERETKAVDGGRGLCNEDGRSGLLASLSIQSRQVRMEMYSSLEHMRAQKAHLQSNLRQLKESNDCCLENHLNERSMDDVYRESQQEESKEMTDGNWLEEEEERVLQKRVDLKELEEDLRRREEVLQRREACLQQKIQLKVRMLRSSQECMEEQRSRGARKDEGVTVAELEEERNMLKEQRDTLDDQLKKNNLLTVEEEHLLLQLEEAIEALDAAVAFKNHSIRDREKKLMVSERSLFQSGSTEPVQLCNVIRKLRELSLPEAVELLIKYFNKVVCLREAECRLRLRYEELELHVGEQEIMLKEMEATVQRLTLDTDRKLTQQHRDHLNTIQLLLQKLKDGGSGAAQQAIQERLEHLEKELFFYKSSSRQLKQKLREILSDSSLPGNQSPQLHPDNTDTIQPQTRTEKAQTTTQNTATYTKVHVAQTDNNTHSLKKRHTHTQSLFSPSPLREAKVAESRLTHSESYCGRVRDQPAESVAMTTVRLCRKDLRQISPPDPQVTRSATSRRQSIVDNSTESIFEDSIEVRMNN